MTREEVIEKYKSGFVVYHNKHHMCDEEWLLDEGTSTEDTLVFLGYDANLFPFPDWKEFDETNEWHRKRKEACNKRTVGFRGVVYMDKVSVTEINERGNK